MAIMSKECAIDIMGREFPNRFLFVQDWSFDLFAEDMAKYKGFPKGVHCSDICSDRQKFIVWFKGLARDFRTEWSKEHKGDYDKYDGYIGDAFARILADACFSDYYKEVYNQRPHLSRWYYIHLLGLPMSEDTGRLFCANPIEDVKDSAKEYREYLENLAREEGM